MEFVSQIVGKLMPIYSFVEPHYNYFISYERNVAKLKTEVQTLTALRTDMQRKVDDAKRKGEVISKSVNDWLGRVNGIIADSNSSQTNEEGHQDVIRCLNWPFACLWQRRKQSKEAQDMAQKVCAIIADGRLLQTKNISFPASAQMTASSFARGYKVMESRTSLLNEIKQALKDPNIYKIGVHGMGGTGKTTLVKELAWQAEQEGGSSFGKVVMATVTNTQDLSRIRGELADMLGLEFKKQTEVGRAGELRGRILEEERIVVILDDIWSELDLAELGVPFGDDHKGCKLVMTSRSLDVLQNMMGTQKNFALKVLTKPESLDLFEKTAGDVVKLPDIDPIARDVVKCCAGLPLLIVIVAKALKGKQNVAVWKDSLKKLKSKRGKQIDDVMMTLRFSYDCLESEEHRSLLLLIGSVGEYGTGLPNNHELFATCWGWRIYENVRTLEEARNRHHTLIEGLRASSLLLEDGADDERLSMHDLVRDMARSVASDEQSTLVLEKLSGINEWLKEGRLQNYDRIILRDYDISELPDEKLDCPELKLLLLGSTAFKKLTVPQNFFSGMTKVNVLHLRRMNYFNKSLPPSLCLLTELTSLNLSICKLEDIKIIGELKSLEILILEDVGKLEEIPKEVGNLTHLRMLNVSNCPELEFIAKNLFSSSKNLEELYLLSYYEHRPLVSAIESNCASLGDIGNLHQLTILELDVENALNFPLNFAELKRYNICIGCRPYDFIDTSKFSKILSVMDSPDSQRSMFNDNGVQLLLKTVECLYLKNLKLSSLLVNMEEICGGLPPFGMLKLIRVERCSKMKNLFWSSHARHLSQLQKMHVSDCESITEIIARETQEREEEVIQLPKLHYLRLSNLPELHSFSSMSNDPKALLDKVAMPNLEVMNLYDIKTLEKIWENVPANPNIQNLTRLTVCRCHGLKSLFPPLVARALVKLEFLEIWDCATLEEIFVQEEEQIQDQYQLEPSSPMVNIEETCCGLPPLGMLKVIKVHGCSKMKNLFRSSQARHLSQLREMKVSECESIKEIVTRETQGREEQVIQLPKLHSLELFRVPELHSFCSMSNDPNKALFDKVAMPNLEFMKLLGIKTLEKIWDNVPAHPNIQNLTRLEVYKCDGLKSLFSPLVARALVKLEYLSIVDCATLEEIFVQDEEQIQDQVTLPNLETPPISSMKNNKSLWPPNSMCKLRHMRIEGCPKLLNVFSLNVLTNLQNLEKLFVKECSELEGIFEVQDQQVPNFLCKLNELIIDGCPKLLNIFPSNVLNNLQNLERLHVEKCSELKSIFEVQDQYVPNFQCKLNKMKIDGCPKLLNIFPSNVLNNLQNLERLHVKKCSELESIFEVQDQHVSNFLCKLNKMKIDGCPKLLNIFPSNVLNNLQNLERLHVKKCSELEDIFKVQYQSVSNFLCKLYEMKICGCPKLLNVMTPLMAASLSELQVLEIANCGSMKEIVANENDDDAPREINFMELWQLDLEEMSRLTSFCSGQYNFNFPSLEEVRVFNCPEMKTFCNGNLTAPRLKKITTSYKYKYKYKYDLYRDLEGGRWDGDLNTTIANIFYEEGLALLNLFQE